MADELTREELGRFKRRGWKPVAATGRDRKGKSWATAGRERGSMKIRGKEYPTEYQGLYSTRGYLDKGYFKGAKKRKGGRSRRRRRSMRKY